MNPTTELLLTFKAKGRASKLHLTLEEAHQLQAQLADAVGALPVVVPVTTLVPVKELVFDPPPVVTYETATGS